MQLIKLINVKIVLLLVLFVAVFFGTRFPRISDDTINPDGVNWHYRSQQFVVGLKSGDFSKTYQHYHPGVTLMWLTGIPIEITKKLLNEPFYDIYNFQTFDTVAKFSLVYAQSVLTVVLIFLLSKVIGFNKSFIVTSLFTFEPFFLGNSRLYHMDVLQSLLTMIGLVLFYLSLNKKIHGWWLVGSAFILALATLTKTISISAAVYCLLSIGVYFVFNRNILKVSEFVKKIMLFIAVFLLTTVAFFPALWMAPFTTIEDIFSESRRIGLKNGHAQIVLGEFTEEAGPQFYPLVIAVKFTPILILGTLVGLAFALQRLKKRSLSDPLLKLALFLAVYYFGYLFVMSIPSKKIDRYMLPMFPFFAVLAVYGYSIIFEKFKKWVFPVTIVAVGVFYIWPLVYFFPYYFVYWSPIFLTASNANNVVAQKPFGVGIYEVRDEISKLPFTQPTLGFIDTKPIKSIYPNSKVFDMREDSSTKYDVAVLAINEQFPEKNLKGKFTFKLTKTINIGGLPYWRIYVKE